MGLILCCKPQNDLCQVLSSRLGRVALPRYDTPAEALAAAPDGSAVALLADGYPETTTVVPPAFLEQAAARGVKLYVEYPSSLPGLELGKPRGTEWERAVISSDFFGPALPKPKILAIHDCHFLPTSAPNPDIVVARVAGFDTAVYGLPKETFPILFELPGGGALVATTKLSQFVTARYAPTEAWRAIWTAILRWLCPGRTIPDLTWTPAVRPSFAAREKLPSDVEARAFRRGATWFLRSGLLATQSADRELAAGVHLDPVQVGDGTHGILEGFSARIHQDGRQDVLGGKRSDCNGESAMAIALNAKVDHDAASRKVASSILDYWLTESIAQRAVRADLKHPTFGLIAWGISNWPPREGLLRRRQRTLSPGRNRHLGASQDPPLG